MHATTNAVPAERLLLERGKLQELPAPYGGRSARSLTPGLTRKAVIGYQHPLSVYEELIPGGAA